MSESNIHFEPAEPAREPLQSAFAEQANPAGLDGIEFVEYQTPRPQALGQVLELMGFAPIARHRARESTLYRQGDLNVVVTAEPDESDSKPRIAALALRVRNAQAAWTHLLDRGAWGVPGHAEIMELNIPALYGPGGSHIYLVDRYQEFSIYDVDFVPIPFAKQAPVLQPNLHWFGVVQYVGPARSADWTAYYSELFGMAALPEDQRFGILPKGELLVAPSYQQQTGFMVQLIEPDRHVIDMSEGLQRVGLGVADVMQAVQQLRARGVEFVETPATHSDVRGALTKTYLGSVMFELVHSERAVPAR